MKTADTTLCFHCSEPLEGSTLTARVNGSEQRVCCIGCRAVAELIQDVGLSDFYKYRRGPNQRPESPSDADRWSHYAARDIADQFIVRRGDVASVTLSIDGLRCAACSWLVDKSLRALPGVRDVSINGATARASVEWQGNSVALADLLRAIASFGFTPHPLNATTVTDVQREERRILLKRFFVAALGMMQVMMFAVAIYTADITHESMDAGIRSYFRIVSLLVSTPVTFYAGWPFFKGAVYSLRARTIGMDVPVAVALLLAYAASTVNTLRGHGEVHFDSVTMFIFFLTLGRLIEMTVRHRTTGVADALARHLPATAHRITDHRCTDVPTQSLVAGDIVLVRVGEILPADGIVIEGTTQIDEALLTGESLPMTREIGANVVAGALNLAQPIQVRVTAVGNGTVLSDIAALLQRVQTQKPRFARAADSAAASFLQYVVLAAAAVCVAWLIIDPSKAFAASLAVLIVACPCAFSIGTPTAIAAAIVQLARHGILVVKADSLEALANVTRCVFDKTGTLTHGKMHLAHCVVNAALDKNNTLAIAAALEQASEHSIAKGFANISTLGKRAEAIQVVPGRGIEGSIEGHRYRIGALNFVAELWHTDVQLESSMTDDTVVVLGDASGSLATFELTDTLRQGGHALVSQLRAMDVDAEILSGDSRAAVEHVALECAIDDFQARQLPAQKVERIRWLQECDESILMIGDGINDAPVLGLSNVSMAMGHGAALAHASADLILIDEQLKSIPYAIDVARRAVRIAKQNLFWAASYNLTALPLAAFGLIPPWLAAIGMSLSSIGVILNATRLLPAERTKQQASLRPNDTADAPKSLRVVVST